MSVDARTASLMAVAASVTANCQRCLEINVARARRCGADPRMIADAVEVGAKVRAGAAGKMDAFAAGLNLGGPSTADDGVKCGCS